MWASKLDSQRTTNSSWKLTGSAPIPAASWKIGRCDPFAPSPGELARSGVRVPAQNIKTVSYMAPTACNDTDAGKAKNRRAEVWFER
jgi:hypothetical protein